MKIILLLALACAVVLYFVPPIAQDPAYHLFADTRGCMGVPNFGDVASNLPFIAVGLYGFAVVWARRNDTATFQQREEYYTALIACFGIFLVGFGSGYYHWEPSNATLVWDRLPMTIGFMAIFALMIMERISVKAGWRLLPVLLIVGITSVWYWHVTETAGRGDLRPYAFVQFFPMLAIPVMLFRLPPRYTGVHYLGWVIAWYIAAKLLEHFDIAVFHLLAGSVSGHTLKHLAAALATLAFMRYLAKRRALAG